ncbi:MAG TPA: hypothetical protein P5320_11250 [Bacteroidales bacterium]|nr:hypothetical protein [Bacteroidales bacterium]HOK74819.1 hypothetical protein [Bacteroidales bacterium]HOU30112.1 hypothetical protein [Bacteroidales bacterium]HPP93227.1 hypothetical protein [Bacteroidales bacterium]HQK71191.1 hypothetical protein [Bacteroidales bacterium]
MDFNSTIDIILKDLKEVREIIEDFKNYPNVPVLQIELAKTKCRSAEEIISLLKVLKPGFEEAERKHEKMKSSDETLIVISEEETAEKEPSAIVKTDIVTEKTEAAQQVTKEEKTAPVRHQESTGKKKATTKIFADKFSGTKQTILDTFGDKKDDGISEILKSQTVRDLTEIIGVNDRFLFIREIFGGNRHAYEEVISKLNSVSSIEEAKDILKNYYSEGEENEVVNQLLNLVKRKLPADE